ncbi:hypothetical protein CYY_000407 [Polysphondylium violaceum]|uniref:Profilin n=1 Tax=Polysphondylium violaceum TaxID=133409 RepID=A0A8J4V2H0_9MYCE|nr:hypothetical protein CYY_000407 [Polysphondylium violaceum]
MSTNTARKRNQDSKGANSNNKKENVKKEDDAQKKGKESNVTFWKQICSSMIDPGFMKSMVIFDLQGHFIYQSNSNKIAEGDEIDLSFLFNRTDIGSKLELLDETYFIDSHTKKYVYAFNPKNRNGVAIETTNNYIILGFFNSKDDDKFHSYEIIGKLGSDLRLTNL